VLILQPASVPPPIEACLFQLLLLKLPSTLSDASISGFVYISAVRSGRKEMKLIMQILGSFDSLCMLFRAAGVLLQDRFSVLSSINSSLTRSLKYALVQTDVNVRSA
jgi:hypothetical protein